MEPQAREVLARFFQDLLAILGEEGRVEVHPRETEVYVNLQGAFRALPQDDPEFREALARLAFLHLKVAGHAPLPLEVDINGQEEARRQKLIAQALALAKRVREEKRPIELEPMPPKDRRIIHLALANVAGVRTHSVGRAENRRVVIEPAELASPEPLRNLPPPVKDRARDEHRGIGAKDDATGHGHSELPQRDPRHHQENDDGQKGGA